MRKKREKTKEQITITIDKKLLKELDDFCGKNYSVARSPIIEKAVSKFLEGERK